MKEGPKILPTIANAWTDLAEAEATASRRTLGLHNFRIPPVFQHTLRVWAVCAPI